MGRVTTALSDFVESIVGFVVMIVLAIIAFYFTVFVVATGASLAGQTVDGNFVVLSGSLLVVAAILAGGLSPVGTLAGMGAGTTTPSPTTEPGSRASGSEAQAGPASQPEGAVAQEPVDATPAGESEPHESLATFQLYVDSGDQWRWRLVHQNGNIIATSGEGYSSDREARRGMRSVVRNAPGAEVDEE